MDYSIIIASESAGTLVAAHGSLKLISLAAKEGLAAMDGISDYTARIVETDGVEGEEKRQITSITAESDVVAMVVKKRLANERKQNEPTVTQDADLPGDGNA